jgi:hypothetical protein
MKLRVLPTALFLLVPQLARAADPLEDFADSTAAERLRLEGRSLVKRGELADGCRKLEESVRLEPGADGELEVADCNERLGRLATAWAAYLAVGQSNGADPTQAKSATKRARALEARVPKLVVAVTSATPGLEVKVDGVVVEDARWGTPIPVDPGNHRITATATGKTRWVTRIDVSEGATARVDVPTELAPTAEAAPPSDQEPAGSPSATEADADSDAAPTSALAVLTTTSASTHGDVGSAPSPMPRPAEPFWQNRSVIGLSLAGVGVAGLGLGVGFGLASLSARDESAGHCAGDFCDRTGVALRADAIAAGNIATVTTLVGAAALAGGLVVILTAKTPRERNEKGGETLVGVRAAPQLAQGGGGVLVQGAFR